MPTYLYETIPASAEMEPEQFEFWQSMKEDPLTHHPVSGVPVRRIISGGFAPIGVSHQKPHGSAAGGQGCQRPGGCGCH